MSDDPLAGDPGWIPTTLPHLLVGDPAAQLLGQPVGQAPVSVRWFKDEAGALVGKAWFGPRAEGPPGHAHGGSMAAVLDEAMGGAAWQSGHPVVAANLDISFRHMLPLDAACVVEARITAADGRKITTTATLRDRDGGQVFAEGRGVFVVLEKRHLDAMSGKADVIVERMRRLRDPEKDD